MNLPNKLTVARMIMTPLFLATLVIDFKFHLFVALVIFIVASLTDMMDGNIARKQGIVTDFGKFLDPIADKILTTSAFVGFLYLGNGMRFGWGMVWVIFIILVREFTVASIRMIAAGKGKVVAADGYGKVKTVMQMVAVIAIIFIEGVLAVWTDCPETLTNAVVIFYNVILWVSTVLTVISGVNYLYKNKEFIDHRK